MGTLKIEFGEETESLLEFVLAEFDDEELDIIQVERETVEGEGLASEPTTVLAVIGLTSVVAIGVCRLIERYLEEKRQRENIKLVLVAYGVSNEAGMAVARIAESHANVAVSFGELPKVKGEKD